MNSYLLILGNASQEDIELCRTVAKTYDLDVCIHPFAAPLTPESLSNLPSGCMSFLPCDKNVILNVFSVMPVGFGQEIPFYQRVDAEKIPPFMFDLPIGGVFYSPLSELVARNIIMSMVRNDIVMRQNREMISEIMKYRKQKHQLIKIGTSLSLQNDLEKLLASILADSRDIVSADAGSIYIRSKNAPGGSFTDKIRFKISQNDSVDIGHKSEEFDITIDSTTVAGFVAFTGKLLNIEDVSKLRDTVPYKTQRIKFEKKFEYPVHSMLTVPLKNMAGEVVGVLQLMNKKVESQCKICTQEDAEQFVVPFSHSDEDFILSIASQAAVSIERVQLYQEIQGIFEGYLRSSVAAIDERDKVTYGHSRRVMGYAMAFADAINCQRQGVFAQEHFNENRKNQFRFAALLHDIGKIGVPEALLSKEARCSKDEIAVIKMRVEYIKALIRSHMNTAMLPWTTENDLDNDIAFVEKINSAGFLPDPDFKRVHDIAQKKYPDMTGNLVPFLSEHDLENLSVRRGNLTPPERERINSHAQATRRILSSIPWTKELERIPDIACHHHERLDGTGYPDGLTSDQICFESKALAVIDIYEALVAQDRPYKPKMPPEKAFEILRMEAASNHIDAGIVDFFIESGTYKIFLDEQV